MFNDDLRAIADDVLAGSTEADTDTLWMSVVALDWPLVGVPESSGGAGGDLADALELAAAAGRNASPIPLWETGLAAWVLASSGLGLEVLQRGGVAVVAPDQQVRLESSATGLRVVARVPAVTWLRPAGGVVLVLPSAGRVVALGPGDLGPASFSTNVADEPVGDLVLDCTAEQVADLDPALLPAFEARRALLRSAAILGAVERCCSMTLDHVRDRHQFGKPLIALQAVAHGLADMTLERRRLTSAVQEGLDRGSLGTALAARAVAGSSAGTVARIAHQLHGAMGITREHQLHFVTRRLWAWTDQDVTTRYAEEAVGRLVLAGSGDDELWALSTDGR
ncbi:MAG: putative acyl-CoA dehydrogenase [Marmoricola sp.]|nr:putative acyl-CoA dehydrogenase [Marmoricola sp.]